MSFFAIPGGVEQHAPLMPDEIQLPEFSAELEPDPEPRERPSPVAEHIAAAKLEKVVAALYPNYDQREELALSLREIAGKTGLAFHKIEETIYDTAKKLKDVQIRAVLDELRTCFFKAVRSFLDENESELAHE